jgi:DNA-binding NarL/FixJ family response regulator
MINSYSNARSPVLQGHLLSSLQSRMLVLEPLPECVRADCLGLTPRQAKVLEWVAAGKTNADIGSILQAGSLAITKNAVCQAYATSTSRRKHRDE